MNIINQQNTFRQDDSNGDEISINAEIITHIETINSIARKKTTDYLKKHQVNYQQWRILKSIHLELATTPAKVSAAIFTDSGTISRQLELLEAKGLVSREHSKKDRRVVNLKLSSKGEYIASEGIKFTEKLMESVQNEIGDIKIREFYDALVGTLRCSAFQSDSDSI
ncbi:MAG: MarR family winged helix-turn-helix transcriptional regulator [Gammaproteobacteria bacterium]